MLALIVDDSRTMRRIVGLSFVLAARAESLRDKLASLMGFEIAA